MMPKIVSIFVIVFSILADKLSSRYAPRLEPKRYPSNDTNSSETTKHEVCMSESCKAIAKNLRLAMDVQADPCVDFYE
ncbi:hypothetical protein M514_24993 [Trichuris suis]|nr:hypothetical protein M514_24993 [Trichuris suis]